MRCSAALSCRLPERVIRTRPAVLPDQTGIGRHAGVAGECSLGLEPADPGGLADELGRGQRPAAGHRQQRGATSRDAVTDPFAPMSLIRSGERDDVGQLVAGQLGDQPGHGVEPGPQRPLMLGQVQRPRFGARAGSSSCTRHSNRLIVAVRCPTRSSRRSTNSFSSREPRRGRRPAGPARAAPPAPPPTRRSGRTCRGSARGPALGHHLRRHPHHRCPAVSRSRSNRADR